MIVYSFDSGTHNLGFCCIEVNYDLVHTLKSMMGDIRGCLERGEINRETLALCEKARSVADSIFKVHKCDTFDVAPSDKTNIVEMAAKLRIVLDGLAADLPKCDIVLLERQMHFCDKVKTIMCFLCMYYVGVDTRIIGASLKNTVQIDQSDRGAHGYWVERYSNKVANKKHTTHNYLYYAERAKLPVLCRKKKDDAADAFMMAVAFVQKCQMSKYCAA